MIQTTQTSLICQILYWEALSARFVISTSCISQPRPRESTCHGARLPLSASFCRASSAFTLVSACAPHAALLFVLLLHFRRFRDSRYVSVCLMRQTCDRSLSVACLLSESGRREAWTPLQKRVRSVAYSWRRPSRHHRRCSRNMTCPTLNVQTLSGGENCRYPCPELTCRICSQN
ncbi:hypothetical protein BDY19DRAFT_390228 [Irpex rosettiformis]|uniref:Uncharacterized protein n=1 Tax=Irpex rosettiformis TaxID=378272 RepID=A0ACB8TUM9_9APHY|nr:hypothetical protein BDY19DRAFT_390228 [Irpex rosettiformis]